MKLEIKEFIRHLLNRLEHKAFKENNTFPWKPQKK